MDIHKAQEIDDPFASGSIDELIDQIKMSEETLLSGKNLLWSKIVGSYREFMEMMIEKYRKKVEILPGMLLF